MCPIGGAASATRNAVISSPIAWGKVCWRVEAVRNDREIRTRARHVEVEKPGAERGKYQHSEHYDQPPGDGLSPRARPERAWAQQTEPAMKSSLAVVVREKSFGEYPVVTGPH